jgi:hypothetical protein
MHYVCITIFHFNSLAVSSPEFESPFPTHFREAHCAIATAETPVNIKEVAFGK